MHIFGFSLRCVHSITGHRTAPLLMNKCHTSSSAPRKRLMNIQIWEGEWLNLPQWNKRSESCEVCGISTGWLKEITLQNVNNFSYFGMKIIPFRLSPMSLHISFVHVTTSTPYFCTSYFTLRNIFRHSLNWQKTGLCLTEHVSSQSEASPPVFESWREAYLTL